MAITHTDTAATVIGEIWSAMTADDREKNLEMSNLVDRRYEDEFKSKGWGDTIHIEGFGNQSTLSNALSLSGSSRSTTYDAGQFNAHINLVIDTHAYKAFDLGSETEIFSHLPVFERLAGKAGYALATSVDDVLGGLIDDFSNDLGTLAVPLTDALVRLGVQTLNTNDVPEGDRYFYMSSLQQMEFNGIEKYTNSLFKSALGGLNPVSGKFKGFFGDLYGLDWYMSTNTDGTDPAGHDNGMWHRESIAFAMLENMREQRFYDIDSDTTKFAVHVLHGSVIVRNDHGVWAKGA